MSKCIECLFFIQGESSAVCAHPKGDEQYRYWIHECNIFGELRDGFEKTDLKSHKERAEQIGWKANKRIDEMANGEMYELIYYTKPE